VNIARRNFVKSAALLAVAGIPTFGSGDTCTDDATLLSLGLKKQLFLDNLLVESAQDITRQFHSPQKYEGNPLIVKDKPWERELSSAGMAKFLNGNKNGFSGTSTLIPRMAFIGSNRHLVSIARMDRTPIFTGRPAAV